MQRIQTLEGIKKETIEYEKIDEETLQTLCSFGPEKSCWSKEDLSDFFLSEEQTKDSSDCSGTMRH